MINRLFTLVVLLGLAFSNYSQESIVWASEVLDVSTEYGPLEYSALQALHKPNVLPRGGENPNAWRPKRASGSGEFIIVSFPEAIRAQQIAIAESENPGAITRVMAFDDKYNEYTLFQLTPRVLPIETRLLNLFFPKTQYKLKAIRIDLNGEAVPGYNSIDAIGISSSNIPINVLIDLAKGVSRKVDAEKLSENVNSTYVEHSPIITPDGKKLYFSRQYHPDNVGGTNDPEDIWVSDWDEEKGEWKPAVNAGPPLNTAGPNFISSISSIGGKDVLILGNRYGKKGRMYSGISIATYENGQFSDPAAVEVANEYNYSTKADFFLSTDGKALIQSVERDDAYGGRDLYVSFKRGNSSIWSEPLNLGTDINTASEEAAPFLAKDGKTLYFSSSGYSGYGGLDIYVTRRLDDTWKNWSIPDNLGAGINTELDDQYFSIPSSGAQLYFTRGRKDEDTDIFTFTVNEFFVDPDDPIVQSVEHLDMEEEEVPVFITVRGSVINSKTNEPVSGVPVKVERLPDGIAIGEVNANESGAYQFTLRPGARFGISAALEGYIPQNENIDLNNIEETDTIEMNLLLSPIEVGQPVVIRNIFFEVNQSVLKTASYPELERILEYLTSGRIQRIEISGHSSSDGPDDYNLALSERRANAVQQFFLNNGISQDRIESVGYGEQRPIASNATLDGRQKNRRVEFKVLETGK